MITGKLDFTVATDSGKLEGEKAGLRTIIDMAKLKIPFQLLHGDDGKDHPTKS